MAAPGRAEASRDQPARRILPVLAAIWIVVSAVAWIVRWPAMNGGGDNASYLLLAAELAFEGRYAETWTPGSPPHAKYPPVYPAVLAVMMLAGAETWGAFKAASALFVGLASALAFLWVRRCSKGLAAAVAIALVFGLSPAMLNASRWVLSDALFVALTVGAFWLLTPRRIVCADSARSPAASPPAPSSAWLPAGGLALAGLAYFTRSAGLPLVAAAAICLAAGRRWRALAAFAACFLPLAVLWASRSSESAYVSEFWLSHPFFPELGTFGAGEFLNRLAGNVWRYVTGVIPGGLAGWSGTWAAAMGIGFASLAVWGWIRRLRRSVGPAEVFLPLYAALLAAWPSQWIADRYALPLLPVLLLFAAEALRSLAGRLRVPAAYAVAAGGLAVGVPLVWSVSKTAVATNEAASSCRSAASPVTCDDARTAAHAALGVWAAQHLPDDAVVLARKSRIFHLFSGLPSARWPMSSDDGAFFALSDSLGAQYVAVVPGDDLTAMYMEPVMERHPDRFCVQRALRIEPQFVVGLLEITESGGADSEGTGSIGPCPDMPSSDVPTDWTPLGSDEVPVVAHARGAP